MWALKAANVREFTFWHQVFGTLLFGMRLPTLDGSFLQLSRLASWASTSDTSSPIDSASKMRRAPAVA